MRRDSASRCVLLRRLSLGVPSIGALLLLALLLTACANSNKSPPPLQPPDVTLIVTYRSGAILAMPTTKPEAVNLSPQDCYVIHARWVAMTRLPEHLRPISSD